MAMPSPATQTDREVLAGMVERVTFHSVETGFCVLRVKARGHRDLATIVGHAAAISAGEWITASGDWVNDRTHGQEFKARFMRTSAPSSVGVIEKYLSSGMIRGIGPSYASKMVKAFGEKVFDIIEAEPDRLREVDGIGPIRAQRITAAWAEQKIVREIMVFLHSHGVGTARAVRIYKTYGADAIQVMTENPYRLARDIRGIGFKTADAIAMHQEDSIGPGPRWDVIRTHRSNGRRPLRPADRGIGAACRRVAGNPKELVAAALELELAEGTVIADTVDATPCVFLGGLYRAEQVVAERLRLLNAGTLPWSPIDPDKAMPCIERRTGLSLAESQIAAIRLALLSKVLVITGGPGVGKTTSCARASLPPSNASFSRGTASRRRPRRAMPRSRSSEASTIGAAIPRSDICHRSTTSTDITRWWSIPTHTRLPSCSRPSRTSPPGGRKMRPSLTAAARDGRTIVRVGTEEWLRRGPNQRMARHRRATCRQIRASKPKLSPLHETGAGPQNATPCLAQVLARPRKASRQSRPDRCASRR